MFKFRSAAAIGLAGTALTLALPAAAGTLAPQLRALADSYHKAPKTTLSRAVHAAGNRASRLFAPHVNAAGEVQVYIHYRAGLAPSGAALAGLDASRVLVSRPLGVVQAWMPIAKLNAAAALAGVRRVSLPVYGMAKGTAGVRPAADTCKPVPSVAIDNEGIAAENVGPVQAAGVTGAGVKVGVISTGVDCRSVSQAKGYLPNNIWIDSTLSGAGDEGTAMLEEVHAMAPDAALGFCGYDPSSNPPGITTLEFLQCLNNLAGWGANVISDDLGFLPVGYNYSNFADPNTGGNAITEFAQAHPDITLTAAAGNDRTDYFEAAYVADTDPHLPNGTKISLSPNYTVGGPLKKYEASGRSYNSALDFGAALGKSSDAAITVTIRSLDPNVTLFADLTWNDPADGPYDDLDLFLLNKNAKVACQPKDDDSEWCSSTLDQTTYAGGKTGLPPFEYLSYTNDTKGTQTLYLVALCYDCSAHGTNPLHVKLYGFMNGGGTFDYTANGGISGHAALAAELTAAAAHWNGGGVNSTIENFSDAGPFQYGDWLNGTQSRAKPDVTGTDGVTVSGAGGFADGGPFYGTSAASPNVGAVIALLRSFALNAEPDAAHWKRLVMDHANPNALTNYTLDRGGAGLVDATSALTALDQPITAAITAPTGSPAKVDPDTDVQFKGECDYSGKYSLTRRWSFGQSGSGAPPDATGAAPAPVQYANGGIYTVTFTCADKLQSKSANLTVAVQAAATAEDVSLNTDYETAANGQFQASGVGGEQVTYEVADQPKHGTVQANGSTSFVYTPNSGFSGKDSFTYDVDNGVEKSNAATVTVTVAAKPKPPSGDGGGAFGGPALGLLGGLAGLLLFLRRKRRA